MREQPIVLPSVFITSVQVQQIFVGSVTMFEALDRAIEVNRPRRSAGSAGRGSKPH